MAGSVHSWMEVGLMVVCVVMDEEGGQDQQHLKKRRV